MTLWSDTSVRLSQTRKRFIISNKMTERTQNYLHYRIEHDFILKTQAEDKSVEGNVWRHISNVHEGTISHFSQWVIIISKYGILYIWGHVNSELTLHSLTFKDIATLFKFFMERITCEFI